MTDDPSNERELRPIVCLADSQLLFWHDPRREEPWLATVRRWLPDRRPRAAYLGASNGDDPAFYSIFASAMETIGITDHRMILSTFPDEDRTFLEGADLILLAGGDPVRGWRVFEQSGMREVVTQRYFEGAVLAGVSAGAVQLGWAAAPSERDPASLGREDVELTFRLVPAIVGAHEEADEWSTLQRLLRVSELSVRGIGIPSGGGLLYHPDGTVEPIRRPLQELVVEEERLRQSLLLPAAESSTEESEAPEQTEETDDAATEAPTVH